MTRLRIHYLQHVPYEDIGCIENWAVEKEHRLSSTKFYEHTALPSMETFDWLIIMGGPMGVYEKEKYPWLTAEINFIRKAIESDKTVLGICLGSQLIASALDASVYPNKEKEIGWFPIGITEVDNNPIFSDKNTFSVFHWHGDTFDLPRNATLLASSIACQNQAFLYRKKVIGLQFHFEVTETSLKQMLYFGKNELVEAPHVQSEETIIRNKFFIPENNERMYSLLNYLETK